MRKFFLVNRLKGDFREIFSPGNIPPIRYTLTPISYMYMYMYMYKVYSSYCLLGCSIDWFL